MPGKNPEKLLLSTASGNITLIAKRWRKLQVNSKASNNIDFLGQYKFPFLIFLGKHIQVACGERPEAFPLIIILTTSAEINNVMTGNSFTEVQQANGRYCPKLCKKNHCMAIFEELQT